MIFYLWTHYELTEKIDIKNRQKLQIAKLYLQQKKQNTLLHSGYTKRANNPHPSWCSNWASCRSCPVHSPSLWSPWPRSWHSSSAPACARTHSGGYSACWPWAAWWPWGRRLLAWLAECLSSCSTGCCRSRSRRSSADLAAVWARICGFACGWRIRLWVGSCSWTLLVAVVVVVVVVVEPLPEIHNSN